MAPETSSSTEAEQPLHDSHGADDLASVILIERGDDVAAICGRVDTAPTFAVVLHAPHGNRQLTTELGMRRVQRHADDSGKVIALATTSISLANRARQVGIAVARKPEYVRWDAPGKRVVRLGGRTLAMPAMGAWIQAVAIVAIGLVFLGLALTMAPSANVAVVPPAETLTEMVTITASADYSAIDMEALQVPASTISSTRRMTLTQPTTGTALVGTQPAQVGLIITNPSASAVTLPAGTVLLGGPDFYAYELDAEVEIPAGGEIEASATSTELGEQYNLPPDSVTGWLEPDHRDLIVTNPEAALGGASEDRPAVAPNDIAALNQVARDLERSESVRRLVLEDRPHDAVFLRTATTSVTTHEPSAQPGTPADFVIMDVDVTVSVLAILQQTLEEVARNVLAQDGIGEFVPGSVKAVETGAAAVDTETNTIQTDLLVSGAFARNVTRDAIRDAVKGKSTDAAKSTLVDRYDIQDPKVSLSPGWAPWLPRFDFRVDVELLTEDQAQQTAEATPEQNGTVTPTATPAPGP